MTINQSGNIPKGKMQRMIVVTTWRIVTFLRETNVLAKQNMRMKRGGDS